MQGVALKNCSVNDTKTKLAVFDIDNTLVLANTHYEFAERFLSKNRRILFVIYKMITWIPLRKALNYLHKDDIRRRVSAYFLKTFSEQILDKAASEMIAENYSLWRNEEVEKLLVAMRRAGFRVVLASATLDFLAKAVAEKLEVEFVASAYSNGRITDDLTGKKVERIRATFNNPEISLFVSDNREDITDFAEVFVVVVGKRLFWSRPTQNEEHSDAAEYAVNAL